MAERLNEEEMNLVKKSITASDKMTDEEKTKMDYIKSKPVRVEDVISMINVQYPIPSKEEMDLTKRLIESQGTLKVTSDEAETLDDIRYKRASLQDVVDVVMSAYKGSINGHYRDLKNELFLVQIMMRDLVVSKSELKKMAKKLNATGDLSDEGLKKVNAAHLVLSKKDFETAAKTREEAYDKIIDQMNKQTEALDKIQESQGR